MTTGKRDLRCELMEHGNFQSELYSEITRVCITAFKCVKILTFIILNGVRRNGIFFLALSGQSVDILTCGFQDSSVSNISFIANVLVLHYRR